MEAGMEDAEAQIPPATLAAPVAPLLLIAAKLFTADGRMLVTLLEMSADYSVAAAPTPPPAGSIAVLSRCGARVPATVAWVDGQRIGLLFDRPLADAQLAQIAG
jgi:hypothetical protein